MTELERRIKAKIPGPDTGIEVRHTMCDICSPGMHCGINAYIKDGKVIKIEGIDGHPSNDGRLCTKGMANREYIYREDRIKTPLRRVGKRGEGRFEPISWEEAYEEIAKGLNRCKEKYGAESVAFYSGYSKWYRQMLRRLAYAFGSPNYGCESSACNGLDISFIELLYICCVLFKPVHVPVYVGPVNPVILNEHIGNCMGQRAVRAGFWLEE